MKRNTLKTATATVSPMATRTDGIVSYPGRKRRQASALLARFWVPNTVRGRWSRKAQTKTPSLLRNEDEHLEEAARSRRFLEPSMSQLVWPAARSLALAENFMSVTRTQTNYLIVWNLSIFIYLRFRILICFFFSSFR